MIFSAIRTQGPIFSFRPQARRQARLRRGFRHAIVAALTLAAVAGGLAGPAMAKKAYIVMEAESGKVLASVNADVYHPPASLTKMMVLYMAFEAIEAGTLSLDQQLLVSRRAARQRPSRLGLGARTRIRVRDAIMAMITKSANDAAVVVAEGLGKSEHKFARMMTTRAREMGMKRTTFRNATGLYSRGQISSARDMAILARALIRDFPQYYGRFATQTFTFKGRTYRNHNRLLGRYPGLDGIKTGYIKASGFNVAVSAVRNGTRLVAVYLGGKTARKRDRRMAQILDKSFATLAANSVADARNSPTRSSGTPRTGKKIAVIAAASGETLSGWAIQVGAFYRKSTARRVIARTRKRLPGWFETDQVAILPVAVRRGTVYRARFYGLTQIRAEDACEALQKKRHRCLTIAPLNVTVASAE